MIPGKGKVPVELSSKLQIPFPKPPNFTDGCFTRPPQAGLRRCGKSPFGSREEKGGATPKKPPAADSSVRPGRFGPRGVPRPVARGVGARIPRQGRRADGGRAPDPLVGFGAPKFSGSRLEKTPTKPTLVLFMGIWITLLP